MTSPRQLRSAKLRFGSFMSQSVEMMPSDATIESVLRRMIDQDVSCMLIQNHSDVIVGIVTERDVLRRYALLEVADKQGRSIATLMTRPVRFARLSTLRGDLAQLHSEARLRHFPVIDGDMPTASNVVGMVTMTDLGRQYLWEMAVLTGGGAHDPIQVVGTATPGAELTIRTLNGLGFAVNRTIDALDGPEPALVDVDGLPAATVRRLLVEALRHPAVVVFTGTHRPELPEVDACIRHGHSWVDKPLDLMLVDWLLRRKAAAPR